MSDTHSKLPESVSWAENEIARSSCYRRSASVTPVMTASTASVAACVDQYDADRAARAGLLELSMLPRCGYRGVGTPELLASKGLPIPARPNTAATSANGDCVLRLSQREYWVLGSVADLGTAVAAFPADMADTPANCYPLFCMDSHAWLMLTGKDIAEVLTRVCGVDMRESAFPHGSIAQTSIARINAILVRQQINNLPVISILCDSASSDYLWTALLEAVQEFEGGAVGINVLR
jgi:sarcosine oxidase, subunit gamma